MDGPMMVYAGFLGFTLMCLFVTIYMIVKRSPKQQADQKLPQSK